jgi:hypothetical protein
MYHVCVNGHPQYNCNQIRPILRYSHIKMSDDGIYHMPNHATYICCIKSCLTETYILYIIFVIETQWYAPIQIMQ